MILYFIAGFISGVVGVLMFGKWISKRYYEDVDGKWHRKDW